MEQDKHAGEFVVLIANYSSRKKDEFVLDT
jgi:hypothetical protein